MPATSPSSPREAARPELRALTGLRFFVAAHVVLYHFAGAALPDATPALVRNFIGHGYVGVSFFYLLSGFILTYSYAERSGDGVRLRGTSRRFFARRLARIYPLYLLAWLLAAPFVIAHRFGGGDSILTALAKLGASALVSLSLAQAWLPGANTWWNPPGWSISVEAFFYLAFPWLLPRLVPRRASLAAFVALYVAALVPPLVHLLARGGETSLAAVKYNPLCHLPVFAMGMLLARAFDSPLRAAVERHRGVFLTLGLAASLAVVARPVDALYLFIHNGLLAPAFGACLLAVATSRRASAYLASPTLVLLGEASYGVYILQAPLWLGWRRLARVASLDLAPLVDFALYFAALCAISLLAFKLLESPARRILRARMETA